MKYGESSLWSEKLSNMSNVPQKITPARDLKECVICLRRFALDRIGAHEAICKSSSSITRKCFDTSQQRISGTEVERFANSIKAPPNEPMKSASYTLTTNWRRKHEELMKIINEKKKRNKIKPRANDLPFPPPMETAEEWIQCPHCSRPLLQQSASAHINVCGANMCSPNAKTESVSNVQSSQTAIEK